MRIIGAADEFWRLRLTRVDTTESFDLDWHEDILYREPNADHGDEVEIWHVEAVSLEGEETQVRLQSFGDRADAEEFVERVREDLAEMTKAQFEEAYITPG
jgi:hypothetical protein